VLKRQRTGSVVCPGCGLLVGVNDRTCYNCGRWNPSLWGYSPLLRSLGHDLGFVQLIMGTTIVLYVLTLAWSGSEIRMDGLLRLLSPSVEALFVFGGSGAVPVFGYGRWWTVLTAGWLHGGLLHIAFNLLWVRQLAPANADLYGPGRTVIIYTVSGIVGFTLSSLMGVLAPGLPFIGGARLTVGASAPIFGLLGSLVFYGRRMGSSHIGGVAWQYAIILFIFGLVFPGVDNYAHAGGFAGGYLAALLLNPARPERIDHIIVAVVCLAVTFVALLASVLLALPYLG
jgi:rhomboid protease GluP